MKLFQIKLFLGICLGLAIWLWVGPIAVWGALQCTGSGTYTFLTKDCNPPDASHSIYWCSTSENRSDRSATCTFGNWDASGITCRHASGSCYGGGDYCKTGYSWGCDYADATACSSNSVGCTVCDDAYTCPSACGYAGGTVYDGCGGAHTCPSTGSCCTPDCTGAGNYFEGQPFPSANGCGNCTGTKKKSCNVSGPATACLNTPVSFSGTAKGYNISLFGMYSSPTAAQGNWTPRLETPNGNPLNPTFTYSTPGQYYVVCNVTQADGTKCTGNPFVIPAGWSDCSQNGDTDSIIVNVVNSTAGTWGAWSGCTSSCGQNEVRNCTLGQCNGNCQLTNGTWGVTENRTCGSVTATTPGQVTIVSPNGTSVNPTVINGTSTNLIWNSLGDVYTDYYGYRVFDVTGGAYIVGNGSSGVSAGMATSTSVGSLVSGHTYYWEVQAVNNSCAGLPAGITSGPWSTKGYFIINSPPTNSLELNNSVETVVPVDVGSSNHICQTIFTGTANPRTIVVKVTATDANGAADIVSTGFRLNATTSVYSNGTITNGTNWSLAAPVTYTDSGNNRTFKFRLNLNGLNSTSLYHLEAIATDTGGQTSGWVDSGRDFKVWDCNVAVAGTIYELSGGDLCNPTSPPIVASADLGYSQTIFSAGANTVTINGNTITMTYSSPPSLYWGRQYLAGLNAIAGTSPKARIDESVSCNSNLFYATPNAYVAAPGMSINFSSIRNQNPWWQAAGGGVFTTSLISDNVPITCSTTAGCTPGITIENSGVGDSSDGIIIGSGINNNSGCSLSASGPCYRTRPRDMYRVGAMAFSEPSTYTSLYNSLYVVGGLGTLLTGPKNMSDMATNLGVVFIDGDFTINQNRILNQGEYLMVIVKGVISIDQAVTRVDGIFVNTGNINITGTNANQLNINGSIFSGGTVNISRGYQATDVNNGSPAVRFNYDPRFLFSMPAKVSQVLSNLKVGQ